MRRHFNVEGACYPEEHYMVNLDERIYEIKSLVDKNKYFSINRGRQYGKTTTLELLRRKISEDYEVFSLSFEGISNESYASEKIFCHMFCGLLFDAIKYEEVTGISISARNILEKITSQESEDVSFRSLSNLITDMCNTSDKPIVLIIDEVDQAGNNEIFLTFLGMLRSKYLKRKQRKTFWSVILAGVYDIRNLKLKIRNEDEHQKNSPWNIAADFDVEMNLSLDGIKGMLNEYECDNHVGMNTLEMSEIIYSYTSGYPFLVSRICQLLDEKIPSDGKKAECKSTWTKDGFLQAVKYLLMEKNPLFESLINKIQDYPELRKMLYAILFNGDKITFNPDNDVINLAAMFGFVKNNNGILVISNRIFETRLYNYFLSEEELSNKLYTQGSMDKNQFIVGGVLDMEKVLQKFTEHWNDLYNLAEDKFIEDNGRKFFLLYLKPIINGVGNYYIESQTRDNKRTDVIVDYRGKQYIVEIKIWHGNEYNKRGEVQLKGYLDSYRIQKGYLLSFNFNKNKQIGTKEITIDGKQIFEVVV
jgi:hypothetical protein